MYQRFAGLPKMAATKWRRRVAGRLVTVKPVVVAPYFNLRRCGFLFGRVGQVVGNSGAVCGYIFALYQTVKHRIDFCFGILRATERLDRRAQGFFRTRRRTAAFDQIGENQIGQLLRFFLLTGCVFTFVVALASFVAGEGAMQGRASMATARSQWMPVLFMCRISASNPVSFEMI